MKKCAYLLIKMSCLILAINLLVAGGSPGEADAATKVKSTSIKRITKASGNAIKLKWKKVKSASGYKIYRSTAKNGKYRCSATVKKRTTYKDKVQINKEYFYKIRVCKKVNSKKYYSNYSKAYRVRLVAGTNKNNKKTTLTKSTNVDTSVINVVYTTKDNKLDIRFKQLSDITGYKIYRINARANENYKLIKTISANNDRYIDQTAKAGKVYKYKIQAYKIIDGKEYTGDFSNEEKGVTRNIEDPDDYETTSDAISNEVLRLMNNYRVGMGLKPLKMTHKLNKVAKLRAKEVQTLVSHTRPNGTKYYTAYEEIGVIANVSSENLITSKDYINLDTDYENGQMKDETVSRLAKFFFDSWYNSPGHRKNMESTLATRVGIGVYLEGTSINIVQNFAN